MLIYYANEFEWRMVIFKIIRVQFVLIRIFKYSAIICEYFTVEIIVLSLITNMALLINKFKCY